MKATPNVLPKTVVPEVPPPAIDAGSSSSYGTAELEADLCVLYDQKKYHEILVLAPLVLETSPISSSRVVLALTLFKLGRSEGASRELAVAIENERVTGKRERLMGYLVDFFKELGLPEKGERCYREMIDLAKVSSDPNAAQRMMGYEAQLQELISDKQRYLKKRYETQRKPSTGNRPAIRDDLEGREFLIFEKPSLFSFSSPAFLPITVLTASEELLFSQELLPHEQAERFMECGGLVTEGSLTGRVLLAHSLVEDAVSQLQRWMAGAPHPERDPMTSLFHAARLFVPWYIFESLVRSPLLVEYMQQRLDEHPEIEVTLSPKKFGKLLHRWAKGTGTSALSSICTVAVKHRVILGLMELFGHHYSSARVHFEWVLSVLTKTRRKFAAISEGNDYLCKASRRLVAMWLCQCHMLGSLEATGRVYGTLLADLVLASETNNASEHFQGRLSAFFACCGFLYEKFAASEGYNVSVEDSEEAAVLAYKYDPANVCEMVRKYVIAATCRAPDDPTTCTLYEKVIWGILLHGGIHMKTLWFFMVLHNQCLATADYGPIHVRSETHQYRLFAEDDVLGQHENGWAVVARIFDLCESLDDHDAWNPAKAADYLLPQAFTIGSRLVMADHFYNEHSAYTNTRVFVKVLDFQVRPKVRAQLKLPQAVVDESLRMSRDLVILWTEAYSSYHEEVPDAVEAALKAVGQW